MHEKINNEFGKLSSISDQELRAKTSLFKERIIKATKSLSDQIESLKEQYSQEIEQNISVKEQLLERVSKVNKA